ncbi:MAG: hypothetical protein ACR2MD_08190 [Aridibacter sp.]
MSEATKKSTYTNEDNIDAKIDSAKEKISDNLSATADKVHSGADTAKEVLSQKTDKVEDFVRRKTYEAGDLTQQTIEKANQLGHKTAEVINNSSDYVKNFDYDDAKQSVKQTIQQKPQIGLAVAGIFGFLVGLIWRRKRD